MNKRTLLRVLPVLLGLQATGWAQSEARHAMSGEVEARVQRIINGLLPRVRVKDTPSEHLTLVEWMKRLNVPGMSIAVIHGGKVEWARGFGVTRLGGAPVTTETLFQAGSISKPVAAMGALKLVEEGQLNLDKDVNLNLTSWRLPASELTRDKSVTLRGLVTHSAGLTVHGFDGYAAGESVPTLSQVLDGAKPANSAAIRVDIPPGTKWRYSGGGFTVMQQMMLDVTHKPFPELMSELVLNPLGMTHSTYQQPLPAAKAKQAATPYLRDLKAVSGGAHTYPEMAAAGLWSTAGDLALFAVAVQQGLTGTKNPVLSQSTLQEMVTRQFENWGLGFRVDGIGDKTTFSHDGVDEGFDAFLFAYAKTGDGAAIMCNANGAQELARRLMRAIAREYGWSDFQQEERSVVAVAPELLVSYAGSYQLGTRKISFRVRENRLFLAAGNIAVALYASNQNKFFSVAEGDWYEFTAGNAGAIDLTVTYGRTNGRVTGKRID